MCGCIQLILYGRVKLICGHPAWLDRTGWRPEWLTGADFWASFRPGARTIPGQQGAFLTRTPSGLRWEGGLLRWGVLEAGGGAAEVAMCGTGISPNASVDE